MVEAHSPVSHGEILKNQSLGAMAQKYGFSIAQLCIRYCLQLDLLPLPKTANPAHMRSNAAVEFEISHVDMEMLKKIERIKNYGEAGIQAIAGGQQPTDCSEAVLAR